MRYEYSVLAKPTKFSHFSHSRIVNGKEMYVKWIRRGLLELWAMAILAVVVGFLGPFGTYLDATFPMRVWNWFVHLMGAYILVRPTIWFLAEIAKVTSLPRTALQCWGVVLAAFPLALVWQWGASLFFQALGGFVGLLPFALLSSVAILAVVHGAKRVDDRLNAPPRNDSPTTAAAPDPSLPSAPLTPECPQLRMRLDKSFQGPILALQSEDHYVRVHGNVSSALLLMRLRDAIAEMQGLPGRQVHRGWWVAQDAISRSEGNGRAFTLTLTNGVTVPVARDSVEALKRDGFLPSA